ncbi:hypothetical protein HDV57DRAFT_159458 [Trichoderma longibrachiatum]
MQSGDPEHAMGEDASIDRADKGSNICTINDDLGIHPSDQAHESQDERSEEALAKRDQSLDGVPTGEPVEVAIAPQLSKEERFEQGPLSQGPSANFFERPPETSYTLRASQRLDLHIARIRLGTRPI